MAAAAAAALKKVREQIAAKGHTQSDLSKMFHEVDADGNGVLSREEELPKLIKALGLKLTAREKTLFAKAICQEDNEHILLPGFLSVFTPMIPAPREAILDKCFKVLSPSGKDIHVSHLKERLGGGEFAIIGGRRVRMDALISDLQKMFDPAGDGTLTLAGFKNYYRNISPLIQSDSEFNALVEAAWAW
jgi:Ca2+-binding EF-hand superfamily protein